MSIRNLQEHEILEVAGGAVGALPTQYVALDKNLSASISAGNIGGISVGDLAICCCKCHCCKAGMVDLGGLVNPAIR